MTIKTYNTYGSFGLKQYSGYVYEEFLKKLEGNLAARTYKEMSTNHPVIAAVLFCIESLVSRTAFNIEAASDSAEDKEKADFVMECLADMDHTWEGFIRQAVRGLLVHGWNVYEILYKVRGGPSKDRRRRSRHSDGRIGLRAFAHRPQDTLQNWHFDDEGYATAMIQLPPTGGQLLEIPLAKCLHFRTTDEKNNPEGRSILRGAYVPWFRQKRLEEVEGVGAERDLAGLPVARVPSSIMSDNAPEEGKALFQAIQKLVTRIKRDEQEGLVFPSDRDDKGHLLYDFSLLAAGGSSRIQTSPIIERYDRRIAGVMLADFILLGHEKVGSFALASSKTGIFATALAGLMGMVSAEINRQVIPTLLSLNNYSTDDLPSGSFGDFETPDLAEIATYVSNLITAGVLSPDGALEDHMRDIASLPSRDQDELRSAGEEAVDEKTPEPEEPEE